MTHYWSKWRGLQYDWYFVSTDKFRILSYHQSGVETPSPVSFWNRNWLQLGGGCVRHGSVLEVEEVAGKMGEEVAGKMGKG